MALASLAPFAIAADRESSATAVEGHTAYVAHYEERVIEENWAVIAGHARCSLSVASVEIYSAPTCPGSGPSAVYAVAYGAPDPRRDPTLSPTGRTVGFTDPNGVHWSVAEFTYGIPRAPSLVPDYAYVVEVGPEVRDAATGTVYDFLVAVDEARGWDRASLYVGAVP
ncbi:MAG: hypothetical protein ACT4PT_14030 [Methanobacteriota archaeon]